MFGIITGIANEKSVAAGIARSVARMGGTGLAVVQNEKSAKYAAPAIPLGFALDIADVTKEGEIERAFERAAMTGPIDYLVHSMAFANRDDLHGRVTDCSLSGFLQAMDVSTHSLIRLAKLAEPYMTAGGSILTATYLGSQRVIGTYGMMGPVKAALESAVRYLAADLGPRGIRVNAVSPGPLDTRAGSGIKDFDAMLTAAAEHAPMGRVVTADDVGPLAAFLISPASRMITGQVIYVDGGLSIMGV